MATARRPRWLVLRESEHVVRVSGANRTAGRTAAGGWLGMTTERLVHHTHVFEKFVTGTSDWEVPLIRVGGADVAPPAISLRAVFDGSLRPRLRVTTVEGDEAFFVVNDVEEWASVITAATGCELGGDR